MVKIVKRIKKIKSDKPKKIIKKLNNVIIKGRSHPSIKYKVFYETKNKEAWDKAWYDIKTINYLIKQMKQNPHINQMGGDVIKLTIFEIKVEQKSPNAPLFEKSRKLYKTVKL